MHTLTLALTALLHAATRPQNYFFFIARSPSSVRLPFCAPPLKPPTFPSLPFFRSLLRSFRLPLLSLSLSASLPLPLRLRILLSRPRCLLFLSLPRHTQDKDMIDQGRWPAPGSVSSNNFDQAAINRKVCTLNEPLSRGCLLSLYACLVECEGPEVCAAAGIMRRSSRRHLQYNSLQTSSFIFSDLGTGLVSKEARREERERVCVFVCQGQHWRFLLPLPANLRQPHDKSHPFRG